MWFRNGHRLRILLLGALIVCASARRPVAAALAAEARAETLRQSRAAETNADPESDTSDQEESPATIAAVDSADWDRVVRAYAGLHAPSDGDVATIASHTEPNSHGRWEHSAARPHRAPEGNSYYELGRWPLAPPSRVSRR